MNTSWQLTRPLDAVSFDCDGTLSSVEGIDELARQNNVLKLVTEMTHDAMTSSGLSYQLYKKRLELVRPSLEQTQQLAQTYFAHITPDVTTVIRILNSLKKAIYVISAGNNPAVVLFSQMLKIQAQNCFAVNLHFDSSGKYTSFDEQSPMIQAQGKNTILDTIKKQHPRILHIGDGMNDLEVRDNVSRFVGYGGHQYRHNIEQASPFYIKSTSLLPLLALCLTESEIHSLDPDQQSHVKKGQSMLTHYVKIN